MTLMQQPQNAKGVVHFDPQKIGRLREPVIVLRKVDVSKLQHRPTPEADTPWELIGRGQLQLHLREDDLPWYEQGFIVLDQPRDEKVARDIMKATIGFAIARTDTGEILKAYGKNSLQNAVDDAAGVTLTIKPFIAKVASDEQEDEDAVVEQFLAEHKDKISEAPDAQEA